jgi:uncharacterized membrane-anchored protein YhcB (DUF1043 family)
MDNTCSGPCIPYCFTQYRSYYLVIGIIIGVIIMLFYNKYKDKKIKIYY